MKKIAVCIGAAVVIAAVSCDPIGTEDTKVWISGIIYSDTTMATGQAGVVLMLEMDPDSFNVSSSAVTTGTDGRFMMEIQVYPFLPEAEGPTGYMMPSLIFFGLSAHYGGWDFVYRTLDDPFILEIGDTLDVWPIGVGEMN